MERKKCSKKWRIIQLTITQEGHCRGMSKKNQSWIVVKEVKNRFYLGTISIGEKRPQYRAGLNLDYKKKWGFIGKEQDGVGLGLEIGGVVSDWKITKGVG